MVPVELDGFNVGCFCGDNAWAVFDEVATHCDSGSFGIFFLRANGANNPREGDCPALGDLVLVDEEDCVGSFDSVSNALGWVVKFICTRSEPIISAVGILHQIFAFHLFSSDVVCHCKATVLGEFVGVCFMCQECNCFRVSFGEQCRLIVV